MMIKYFNRRAKLWLLWKEVGGITCNRWLRFRALALVNKSFAFIWQSSAGLMLERIGKSSLEWDAGIQ